MAGSLFDILKKGAENIQDSVNRQVREFQRRR